jgi:hypothetical protein
MYKFTATLFFAIISFYANANNLKFKPVTDSLIINIEKYELKKGDTLYFDCSYKYEKPAFSKITLNVIFENLDDKKQWKFRYPLINGTVAPAIVIGNSIPDGKYAVNFLLQNDFLRVKGQIRDYSPKSKGYNYLLLTKNKDSYIGFLSPENGGYFTTPKMIFEDTARIVFSENGKKNQYVYIDLETYLDSTFTPIAKMTEFIQIGAIKNKYDTAITENYKLDLNASKKYTLKDVTVKSTIKKKVELFDEEYSSGLFKFGFPQIFDGIEGTQIGNSMDIFSFLQGRVAGLKVNRDAFGNYNLKWRETNVDVYLDEFKVENEMASYVNPNDIAMVKVFSPMSGGPTGNGCIAIYTKRGAYYTENSTRKYNFQVIGYNPEIDTWK